jgi:hypothetical protein
MSFPNQLTKQAKELQNRQAAPTQETAVQDTRRWLERAVIGLNLCPFAKAVHVKDLIHYSVSDATDIRAVLADVARELDDLVGRDISERETTLLIVPRALGDFLEFNDCLAQAERLVRKRGLEGAIQLASFHPAFQFAEAKADDITNYTNRSPYPTIHLLREESIDRAVAAMPDAHAIYDANIETLRRIGTSGWRDLGVGPSA